MPSVDKSKRKNQATQLPVGILIRDLVRSGMPYREAVRKAWEMKGRSLDENGRLVR